MPELRRDGAREEGLERLPALRGTRLGLAQRLALGGAASYVEATAVGLAKHPTSDVHRQLAAALGEVQEIVGFQTLQVVAPAASKGGNPFTDPELDKLVGHSIRGRGLVHGYSFILDDWQTIG